MVSRGIDTTPYKFSEREINPTVASWFLNYGHEKPINLAFLNNNRIGIFYPNGQEEIIPANEFKERMNELQSILQGLDIKPSANMSIEELEEGVKNVCRAKIELLVELGNIPYRGSELLRDATGMEYLEALSKVEVYSDLKKRFGLNGISAPEMVVQSFIDDQGITTDVLPASSDVFSGNPKDEIPKLGKHLFDKQEF
jgi:hypothetical protein